MLLLFWNGSGTAPTGAVKIVPLKGVVMAKSKVSITGTGKVAT